MVTGISITVTIPVTAKKISLNTKSRLDAQRFLEKYKEAEENRKLNLQPQAEVAGGLKRQTPLFSSLKKIVQLNMFMRITALGRLTL